MSTDIEGQIANLEIKDEATGEFKPVGVCPFGFGGGDGDHGGGGSCPYAHGGSGGSPLVAPTENPRPQLPKVVKKYLAPKAKTKEDRARLYVFRHAPNEAPNTNLFILLHGVGDSHVPFDKLARTLKLPQTATLAIHAKTMGHELPVASLGYAWFQEMEYEEGEMYEEDDEVRVKSLNEVTAKILKLIDMLKDQYPPERIFLLGYRSGAALAMSVASERKLGGCVCVCGGSALKPRTEGEERTPVILLVGDQAEAYTSEEAEAHKEKYGKEAFVHVEKDKEGDDMISKPAEIRAMMEFLASKLVRAIVMPKTT